MKTLRENLPAHNIAAQPVALRLVLYPGEVYRLPELGQRMFVAAGRAWLTTQGHDLVLNADETAQLPVSAEPALISPIGGAPLMVELRS